MKWLLNISFVLLALSSYTQTKNNVELKTFIASSTNKSVELRWVISAGFTCNGTEILWSDDSIHFNKVGEIAGFCGSSSIDVSYDFSHNKPSSNRVNYYKLQLGTNGESQTTSVFFVDLSAENYLVLPNPVQDKCSIYFRNQSNKKVDFTLLNKQGQTLLNQTNIYDKKVNIDLSNFENGIYFFIIKPEIGNPIKGKLMVLH